MSFKFADQKQGKWGHFIFGLNMNEAYSPPNAPDPDLVYLKASLIPKQSDSVITTQRWLHHPQ